MKLVQRQTQRHPRFALTMNCQIALQVRINAKMMQLTAVHAMIGFFSPIGAIAIGAMPIGAIPTGAVFIIGCGIGIVCAIG